MDNVVSRTGVVAHFGRDPDAEHRVVALGHEFHGDFRATQDRQGEEPDDGPRYEEAVANTQSQIVFVTATHAVRERFLFFRRKRREIVDFFTRVFGDDFVEFRALEQIVRQHRDERDSDDERNRECAADDERHIAEHHAGDAGNEENGQEYGDRRQRRCRDGQHDFARALDARLERRIAFFAVAEDVFEGDDGVIDEHTDGQCQTSH